VFEAQLVGILTEDSAAVVPSSSSSSDTPLALVVAVDAEGVAVGVGVPTAQGDDSVPLFQGAVLLYHYQEAVQDDMQDDAPLQTNVSSSSSSRRLVVHSAALSSFATGEAVGGQWVLHQTLYSPGLETDDSSGAASSSVFFGKALALQDSLLVVGAYSLQADGESCVFVYQCEEQEDQRMLWVLQALLQPSDHFPGNLFGECMLIAYTPPVLRCL
jgi:hypothetical protein